MKQKTVAVVGISGVGKTTFLKKLAKTCEFQHLTAGSLIARARSLSFSDRDSLRYSNLGDNQRLLIEGFVEARDPDADVVILDGHVVIDSPDGLTPIDSQVFERIGVDLIAHLEADPFQVFCNRQKDISRERPVLEIEDISTHQRRSLAEARRVAEDLGVKLVRLTHDDAVAFGRTLSNT